MRRLAVIGLLAAATGSVAAAESLSLYDRKDVFAASYCDDFDIDGDLEKGVWSNAVPISGMLLHAGE